MIKQRREIFVLNHTKSQRQEAARNRRTQIINLQRCKYQNQDEKRQLLKSLVPDILNLEHQRQNYRETMLIPVQKIFTDLDFIEKEIFEVIELYLNYEVQFIKSFTLIEMRSTPNFQDEITKLVLEYLSNLLFGRFEIDFLIGSEIIDHLCFIVCYTQQPWILEQTCYTILQLLIIDDEEIIEKFKQLKVIGPIVKNVFKLGYFQNKYFIELISDIITEFSSFDVHKDYSDCLSVVQLWNKIITIEYDDPLFQIQLEASLCYAIYLLTKDYNDQQWKFIYDQHNFQQFLQISLQRIAKFSLYEKTQKSMWDAATGYNSVYLGMIINMISDFDPIEMLHFYSQDLEFLLIVNLKSESQEIVDLNCNVLQILIRCDVTIRLELLRSGIYNWFHMILERGFNNNIYKTQIINVLIEAVNYDDQDYIIHLLNQRIAQALINSIESFELSSEQLRDILSALIFICNVEQEYASQKEQKEQLVLQQSIEHTLENNRNIFIISNKIESMSNQEELEEQFQNLLFMIQTNSQDQIKNITQLK